MHSDTLATSIATCSGYLLSNGRFFEENCWWRVTAAMRGEFWWWCGYFMREYFRLLCDYTIEGPFTENGLKKVFHLANMMQYILLWISTFKPTLEDASKLKNKVVDPKIEFAFHFGISAFLFFSLCTYVLCVLRERTTMARNIHVCYRFYFQANIEDASKSAAIRYLFLICFSGPKNVTFGDILV